MRRIVLALFLVALVAAPASAAARRKVVPAPATWRLSVYYTAVASMHTDRAVPVTGCLVLDCEFGDDALGSYPESFVQAVMDEGTGRIDVGPNAGKYLEWSDNVGYWLDTVPRDSHGGRLVPFVSAAADRRVLPKGTRFAITGCGRQGRHPLAAKVCARLKSADWTIRDEFTPGLGGAGHLDLYIGEETGPGFTDTSDLYFDAKGATIQRR